jgi:hypothetical protein
MAIMTAVRPRPMAAATPMADAAAEGARERPDGEPDDRAEPERHQPDDQRGAGAVDDPREDVAPQLVDPEQVLGRGARVDAGPDDRQVLVARLVGGQQRREHGHEHEQADQYQADHRAGAAQQPLPRVGPAADDLVAFDLEFLGLGLGQAHRMLTSPGSAGRAWRR